MAKNQNPLQSKEAAALLRDPVRLKELLSSPETKKLMGLLSQQKGSLDYAAQQAKKGDFSGLNEMVSQLISTKEGAELAQQMTKKVK
ncbi:MAG: hypothetical protein MJ077_07605 [Oscillospiraceae bacterium]|nr:hypothetical protein [Oscillospiraceae bacterium]